MRIMLTAVAAFLLTGCSIDPGTIPVDGTEKTKSAEAAVDSFRRLYAEGRDVENYRATTPDLRGAVTEKQWTDMFTKYRRTFGKFQSAERVGWREQVGTRNFVVLNYESTFEHAKVLEEFVFVTSDGKQQLSAYHFQSNKKAAD
jgi:hypothetical protein